jgi:hypothetical protein
MSQGRPLITICLRIAWNQGLRREHFKWASKIFKIEKYGLLNLIKRRKNSGKMYGSQTNLRCLLKNALGTM